MGVLVVSTIWHTSPHTTTRHEDEALTDERQLRQLLADMDEWSSLWALYGTVQAQL